MYCPNCGAQQGGSERFCANCGHKMDSSVSSQKVQGTRIKKNYGIFHMFNISDDELKWQVEKHDTLPITKTSRGIAVLTIIVLLALSFLIVAALNAFNSDVPIAYTDVLLSLVIYVPLLFFVYRGHMWAVVALALWYTVDKFSVVALYPAHFNISIIIFWMIGVGPLWVAFRVEQAYRKKKIQASQS